MRAVFLYMRACTCCILLWTLGIEHGAGTNFGVGAYRDGGSAWRWWALQVIVRYGEAVALLAALAL